MHNFASLLYTRAQPGGGNLILHTRLSTAQSYLPFLHAATSSYSGKLDARLPALAYTATTRSCTGSTSLAGGVAAG